MPLNINNLEYCVDSKSNEPIMLINKHIGIDDIEGQGIDGAKFMEELLYLDTLNKSRIQVWINSPGGSVIDGYSIFSTILKTKTPVDTYAVGAVASIAAVIFEAGRKKIMTDYSWLMYHNPFGGENKAQLDTIKQSIVTMIAQRSGISEVEVSKLMDRDTYLPPEEALLLGLCDSIDSTNKENTKYLRKITDKNLFHIECNKVVNSLFTRNIINVNTINQMIKVTMKLGLNDSAPEDSIVKAIEAIENRAFKAEAEAEDLKKVTNKLKEDGEDEKKKLLDKLAKLEAEAAKNEAELNDCKSKLEAIEKDKAKAEEEMKLEKAKNLIEDYAKVGRIKNEEVVKLQWTKIAIVQGIEETKNMIEALPLNKVAPVLNPTGNTVDDAHATSAMALMAKNRVQRNGLKY